MTTPKPTYDVSVNGFGTGFDLSLESAQVHAQVQGGTVMVSYDGGQTWQPYKNDA